MGRMLMHGAASTFSFNGGGIYGSQNDFGLSTNTIVLFAFVLLVATVFSYAYIWVARKFTKQFIWITVCQFSPPPHHRSLLHGRNFADFGFFQGILNILFGLATAIYMLSRKYWSGGIVFLLFSVFTIICFISWIPRIPFSVLILQTSIDVSKKFGHVYLVSLIGGVLAAAFGAWYSVTLVAIYVKYEPNQGGTNPACSSTGVGCSSAKVIGLLVFVTFAMYWISEYA
jgi:hypothetical protein